MLLTHVFADVVACLHYYDLDALMLTDARCSDLAHSAASKIRVFDFSGFEFAAYDDIIFINRLVDVRVPFTDVTKLEFLDERDLLGFIPSALQNCVN
ncbi:hypothetical protein AAVH_25115 [Aphelenchoides avenae]|nr:hypothetical protein AAVH_25115 [Aphelenchus avenae]